MRPSLMNINREHRYIQLRRFRHIKIPDLVVAALSADIANGCREESRNLIFHLLGMRYWRQDEMRARICCASCAVSSGPGLNVDGPIAPRRLGRWKRRAKDRVASLSARSNTREGVQGCTEGGIRRARQRHSRSSSQRTGSR